MSGKMKLSDSDWESLFPVTVFQLGSFSVPLTPLPLEKLSVFAKEFMLIKNDIEKLDISLDSFTSSIPAIAELIATKCPKILSELSNIDVNDIKRLPASAAIGLASACIDINIDSSETFIKNLLALVNKLNRLMTTQTLIQ